MHQLQTWLLEILAWVEAFADSPSGVWILFGISFAESSFFPIPPDALLIPLCLGNPENAFWFATVCSVGSVLGGILGYGIGFYGGRPVLRRLFNEERIAVVSAYYDRYNAWATGIAGLTPLPYKLFTISGGVFSINFKIFVLASILARTLRFFAVAGVVYVLGPAARLFIEAHLAWLTIAFVILLIAGFLLIGKGLHRASKDPGGEAG